jgi:carboxypeptidase Taq
MTIFSRHAVLAMIMLSRLCSQRSLAFGAKASFGRSFRGGAEAAAAMSTSKTLLFSAVSEPESNTKKSPSLQETSVAYNKLITECKTITQLERCSAVLGYDQLVFMPQHADTSQERGHCQAALAGVIHEKSTNPVLLEWMDQAVMDLNTITMDHRKDGNEGDDNGNGLDSLYADERRLLELERKSFLETQRVPAALASKAAELSSSAYAAWVNARNAKDFTMFAPVLQDCFETSMAISKAKRGADDSSDQSTSLYTQMLDQFETGMDPLRINDMFDEIQTALVPLIAKVLASKTPPSTQPLQGKNGHFGLDQQKELSQTIVQRIGFQLETGRIDVSVHPFTSSFSPVDVRITSRFREDEWYQGLAGTIHEGGHAIYEQNLAPSALSIDTALSMGTHESQSLFWERHIGLSKPFWKWATPMLQEAFDDFDYSAEQVYGAVNSVSKSLIRVEADELTYPLHVILRYNIERDVVQGKLDVKDIPERWNKGMKELLDIDVPSDDQGCLQDVHWSALAIGYFPTYLVGAVAAAQLDHYCRRDIPDIEAKIAKGEFTEIQKWLTHKIHRHGRRYKSLDALLEAQLGEKLNPKYFIEYLTTKYSELYQV